MYWKFSRLLISQSPWRAACEDTDGLLKWPLKIAVNVCVLCRLCRLSTPALSRFARCWSNVASCQSLSASSCSVSDSSFSVLFVSTLWWFALGEGSRPGFNHHTTGGHHSFRGCLFWIPGGPESLKRSVLWRACWKESCYSWWQRVGVGHLLTQT